MAYTKNFDSHKTLECKTFDELGQLILISKSKTIRARSALWDKATLLPHAFCLNRIEQLNILWFSVNTDHTPRKVQVRQESHSSFLSSSRRKSTLKLQVIIQYNCTHIQLLYFVLSWATSSCMIKLQEQLLKLRFMKVHFILFVSS